MLRHDDWYVVANVSKGCIVFILRVKQAVGLLDTEDEGLTVLQNVGDTYLTVHTE
jgi:hypothetical protein